MWSIPQRLRPAAQIALMKIVMTLRKVFRLLTRLVLTAIGMALIISTGTTLMDYAVNPAQLFHTKSSVNWTVVSDTFFSWFWPLTLAFIPASSLFVWLRFKLRQFRISRGE